MLFGNAQLDQADARVERRLYAAQEDCRGILRLRRDQVLRRLRERRHHRPVGGRHRVGHQFVHGRPGECLAFPAVRLAAEAGDPIDVKDDPLARVGLRHADERFHRVDTDAELFVQLPVQGLEWGLPRLDLAAGKFPGAGQIAAGCPPGQQDASPRVGQNARYDVDDVHGCTSAAGGRSRERQTCMDALVPRRPTPQLSCPWHCLNFLPEPQGHGSLRPIFGPARDGDSTPSPCASSAWASAASSSAP